MNGDGLVQKNEMARFVKMFLNEDKEKLISELVTKIFQKYDTNKSGFLEKRETLQLLDEFLANQGHPPTSIPQFNRFYAEFDLNGDGLISMIEMAKFVKKYINANVSINIFLIILLQF